MTNSLLPYYLDDGCSIRSGEKDNPNRIKSIMSDSARMHVIAASLDDECDRRSLINSITTSDHWILDICLDYFSTHNPFIVDIMASISLDIGEDVHLMNTSMSTIQRAYEFMEWRFGGSLADEDILFGDINKWRDHALKVFNSTINSGGVAAEDVNGKQAFLDLYSKVNECHGDAFLLLLPRLSKRSLDLIVAAGSALILPHHSSSAVEIDDMMRQMELFLVDVLTAPSTKGRPPLFITIAKSKEDGYTPAGQAETIFFNLMEMIKRVFNLEEHWIRLDGDNIPSPPPSSSSTSTSTSFGGDDGLPPLAHDQKGILFIHDLCENAVDQAYPSLLKARIAALERAATLPFHGLPERDPRPAVGFKRKADLLKDCIRFH